MRCQEALGPQQRTAEDKRQRRLWLFLCQKIAGVVTVTLFEERVPRQGHDTGAEAVPRLTRGAALCVCTMDGASRGVERCTGSATFYSL